MKFRHLIYSVSLFALGLTAFSSCTDEIKFGNSFLEKAPGGDITADTIFNDAEYTRNFLAGCYSRQYYGITFAASYANSVSGWTGKFAGLTDCFQHYYTSTTVYNYYYMGGLNNTLSGVFGFDDEYVWETIRACLTLLYYVDQVPDLTDDEKECMKAEAYCLMATRYFDAFQFYGGLPIVETLFDGSDASYNLPRATAEETVEYIISLLDKAIACSALPWAYTGDEAETETGHWTKAGAMALKCRVLQFAASPLFNSSEGYYGGTTEAEQQYLVWYGGYKSEYWTELKTACKEFLDAIDTNGHYKLLEATDLNSAWTNPTPEQYRLTFRRAYLWEGSPEVIHSVRVTNTNNSKYNWFTWVKNSRNSYCPTQEYVEMFPWRDGTPFDWDEAEANNQLDTMFISADIKSHALTNIVLTRDPRLYETAFVNGVPTSLNWSTATMSGTSFETWVGGATAGQNPDTQTNKFATGYYCMKFILNTNGASGDASGLYIHWPTIRLADIYLMYAEALLQADGNCTGALEYINKVRARVGLPNLEDCDTRYDYTSNTEALLEELLNERAREFGMENIRYLDMIRYKRADLFEKQLHRLVMHRQKQNDSGEWEDYDSKWYGNDNKTADFPTHYRYEREEITAPVRHWWTNGYDPKWYLAPIPSTEINKEYGMIQNPGW
ncbi:MAG: RagB/SusD family nutrient uptake outer membrane protein [Bacteroides sp.]|nr:RagB/SusD family nutrient uptake outer membrane protein [Bacteroides sp.]